MKRLGKFLASLLVVAAVSFAFAPVSEAHTNFSFGFGFNVAPFGYPYPYYPYPNYPYAYPYSYPYYPPNYACDYGYLKTRVAPNYADLYVDGAYAGRLNDLGYNVRLPVGSHKVEFRAPGYRTHRLNVYIQPCRTAVVAYSMYGVR